MFIVSTIKFYSIPVRLSRFDIGVDIYDNPNSLLFPEKACFVLPSFFGFTFVRDYNYPSIE